MLSDLVLFSSTSYESVIRVHKTLESNNYNNNSIIFAVLNVLQCFTIINC